jgi:hypothetical protein
MPEPKCPQTCEVRLVSWPCESSSGRLCDSRLVQRANVSSVPLLC